MRDDGLRGVLLGDPGVVPTGLLLGVLTTGFVLVALELVGAIYLIAVILLLASAAVVCLLVGFVVAAGGGLVAVWAALFPLVFVASVRAGRGGFSRPSFGELFVGALLVTLVAGSVAYALGRAAVDVVVPGLRSGLRRAVPGAPDGDRGGGASTTTGADAGSDSGDAGGRSLPVGRRTLLLLAAGGGLVGAGIGYGYGRGSWCETSPADVSVSNESGRQVDLRVSVSRDGDELFHAAPELGLIDQRGRLEGVGDPKHVEYEKALPIGCSLPVGVRVAVEADDGRSTAETVTFRDPDPPPGGSVSRGTLRIAVTRDGIEVEADIGYGIY